ncbi:hypothetical protein JHN52_01255 [Streptomyces sp. MBT97]|uniref:hypothetical protein n=1 Tax=Streptomyces sp. MBT97 TaxID=2800411 RepID=UPI00190DAE61|nr:hypothetical protein [Streptomyces sp. MBT97]MBK3631608.1 hypothetical protein [Streptomyces sp. MBT97]
MSVEWTGRARVRTTYCWRGGHRAEHTLYEIRDTQANRSGTDRMCCTCGKHTYGWGGEHQFWLRERQKELVREILTALWLAVQIVRSVGRPTEQLSLFEGVSE